MKNLSRKRETENKSNVIQFPARKPQPIIPQEKKMDVNEHITKGEDGYFANVARESIEGICEKGDLTFSKNGVITHILREVQNGK
jgi:hypothetical protein